MSQHIELTDIQTAKPEFVLLSPSPTPARTGPSYGRIVSSDEELYQALESVSQSQLLALDFETNGLDYTLPTFRIIGLGLAWDNGSCYIPWSEMDNKAQYETWSVLNKHCGLIAHNLYFDGGVWFSEFGEHPQGGATSGGEHHPGWVACTQALYKQIANEGWVGQKHGLKDAMMDVLQWENTNETELDEWLITHGYYKGNELKDESPENLLRLYRAGAMSPEKGEMWRAPTEILGKYCCLDAEATYLLHTQHLIPVCERFPVLAEYHCEQFLPVILLHIEQRMWGISMDRPGLQARAEHLTSEIQRLETAFLSHEEVRDHIKGIEQSLLGELAAKEPARLKKEKVSAEPPEYKKDGTRSKNWIKWREREDARIAAGPPISLNWIAWQERWRKAVAGEDPDYRFNPGSPLQLIDLFYTRLGYQVEMLTEKGQPQVSGKALTKLGPAAQLLVERGYLVKELSYISDYIERTEHRDTLHPSFKMPGTSTGRLSSSEPNLQQVTKSKAVMSLFRARPGNVWVDIDFAALESVVAAEFSQDPNLLLLYGNGVPENDIHLFVASKVPGEFGERVRATGYRPENPPPGTVGKAKKACKKERNTAKTVVYACQYGAGVGKVNATLEADNIFLPEEQVRTIWNTYWSTFRGLRDFSRKLQREWEENGGYVLNGVGRPMCVTQDYVKDLLNRFIQSTGHDLLLMYINIYIPELNRRQIPWWPSIIDLHDATTIETPEEYADQVVEVLEWAMDRLNDNLGGIIKHRGKPVVGRDMSEIKEPES